MPEDQDAKPVPMETLEDSGTPGSVIEPGSSSSASTPSSQTPAENKPSSPKNTDRSLIGRLKDTSSIYMLVFFFLVALGAAALIVSVTWDRNSTNNNKSSSLTDDQLAQLQGNTTIVGDSKQTLDIQSNTILEGQLLVRKDVEVAGSIKVGGGLALSSVTVGGQGNFGQLQINGILSVSGDTTFSGQVSVQQTLNVAGSASFGGNVSTAKLTTSNLQLNGDLQINRHIELGGSSPSRSNGSALGSGGTVSVNGTDTGGTVTINTGGSPPAGCFVTVNFTNKFSSTPHVVISPSNSSAASLSYYTNRSSSGFSVCTTNTPASSRTYLFDYFVIN
jgi:cytoskeletal protein CcmA (bactofilin family)